jgi:hypothetical protein
MRKLPIYEAKLNDDEDRLFSIAIVDVPAMDEEWQLFNKEQKFKLEEEEMVITYPLIVADKPIYRNEPFEHYIKFTKDTIKEIALRFHQDGVNHFNVMHTDEEINGKMYIFESWLKGKNDKSNDMGFENVPENSFMVSIQVTDKEYWNNVIKKGQFKGLSMEIFYAMFKPGLELEDFIKVLIESDIDDKIIFNALDSYLKK